MAGPTKAQLEARLRELEADNARLRDEVEARSALTPAPDDASPPDTEVAAPRARGRAAAAVVLIVLGTVLAPLVTTAAFAARQASDTEVFVSTLAPLAEDPAVQQFIIDQSTDAIDEALDTDQLVDDLLDALVDEEARPRLAEAADWLAPLLADQARAATRTAVTAVVESDAFAAAWEEALTITHTQFTAVLEGAGDGAVAIDDAGVVAIRLQPIIEQLKPALVDAGFELAAAIPEIDATFVVAELPGVPQARLGYSALTTLGALLPWVTIVLVVAGVALHPRSSRAVVIAGTILLVEGAVVGGGIAIGGSVAASLLGAQVPVATTEAVYGALTQEVVAIMLAYVVLGLVAIVAGLLAGRSVAALRVRATGGAGLAGAARWLDERGWRPEGLPAALRRNGWLMWVWLGAIFVVLAATLPPLSVGDILLATVLLGLAALVYALVSVPGADPAGVEAEPEPSDRDSADQDPAASI